MWCCGVVVLWCCGVVVVVVVLVVLLLLLLLLVVVVVTKVVMVRNQHLKVHTALPRICTSRFTSRSPAKAIRSQSTSKDSIKMPKRSFYSRLLQRATCPKVTSHCTRHTCCTLTSLTCSDLLRFPLPRKVIAKSENAHGTTMRAQSRRAPAPAHSDSANLRSQQKSRGEAGRGCRHLDQTPVLNHHRKNP